MRSFVYRSIEAASVTVFAVFMVMLGRSITHAFGVLPLSFGLIIVLVCLPFVGYIGADFTSGLVHFAADNFGSDKTWFFGEKFIHPFRQHHVDPMAITRHGFLEVNGDNSLLSLFGVIPAYYLLPATESRLNLVLSVFIFFLFMGLCLTNQIHRWAHMEPARRPAFVSWLQRHWVILPPAVHDTHHTSPYDTYYCITSGWLNKLLEKSKIFEKIITLIKGESQTDN